MKVVFINLLLIFASVHLRVQSTPIGLKEKIASVPTLRAIIDAESGRKWLPCAQKSWTGLRAHPEIQDWIFVKGLRCARLSKTKTEIAKYVGQLGSPLTQFAFPTTRLTLLKEISRFFVSAADGDLATLVKPAEFYLTWSDKSDHDGRASAFEILGRFFFIKKKFETARQQYILSLREKETRHARDRFQQITTTLKSNSAAAGTAATGNSSEKISDDYEAPFAERLAQSIKKKYLLAQLEDLIDYTVLYPGGRKLKNAMDRMGEILTLASDKDTFRDQIQRVLQKANPSVLLEVVRFLYRKADYKNCAALGEHVSRQLTGLAQFLTAKCYHLEGEYKKARDLFDAYLALYPATDESGEARLRLILLNFRVGQDANIVSAVEKYLKGFKNDRYDLWIRYWYVRALQRSKNTQAIAAAAKLVSDYPISYYGLLLAGDPKDQTLRAEDIFTAKTDTNLTTVSPDKTPTEVDTTVPSDDSSTPPPPVLPLPKVSTDTTKTELTPLALDRWGRFKLLAGGGWTEEAAREADELSQFIPSEDWLTWTKVLTENKIYSLSIKLAGQLFDQSPASRSFDLLKETYPKVFEKNVVKESERVKISPLLTWSLMRQESAYQKNIVSASNAMGLMQLLGSTGDEVARDLRRANFDPADDLFDTEINIQIGTTYLARVLRQMDKSVPWALAAYNAGPTKVEQYLKARKLSSADASKGDEQLLLIDELPWFETSFYVKAILRNVLIYKLIDQKKVLVSPDDWRSLVANERN